MKTRGGSPWRKFDGKKNWLCVAGPSVSLVHPFRISVVIYIITLTLSSNKSTVQNLRLQPNHVVGLWAGSPPPTLPYFSPARSHSGWLILLSPCSVIQIWKVNNKLTSLRLYIGVTHSFGYRTHGNICAWHPMLKPTAMSCVRFLVKAYSVVWNYYEPQEAWGTWCYRLSMKVTHKKNK